MTFYFVFFVDDVDGVVDRVVDLVVGLVVDLDPVANFFGIGAVNT